MSEPTDEDRPYMDRDGLEAECERLRVERDRLLKFVENLACDPCEDPRCEPAQRCRTCEASVLLSDTDAKP